MKSIPITLTSKTTCGGFPSTINNGINQGVSFFNYRGYQHERLEPQQFLNNGPRLPHAVMLTCGISSYASGNHL